MTVEVYTKDLCGYCDAAKELLDHMRVPYQTYKIGTDITREQLLETHQTHPTCLLYTSPSPRDRTRSRMPSSA